MNLVRGRPLGCLICGLFLVGSAEAAHAQRLALPPRPADAPGGARVAREVRGLGLEAREDRIFAEIASGNVPTWLRELQPVEITGEVEGRERRATFWVTPDYAAVGSDRDYFLTPLSPQAAQRIGDLVGASLPTRRMVDAIWAAALVRLSPDSIRPSIRMTTVPVFEDHNRTVRAQRMTRGGPPSALVAGHKKDVVLTPRLASPTGRVAIYGWHHRDGRPIQPLYTGHSDRWVDYSHGIRLVARSILVNGDARDLVEALRDEALAPLFSDEGVIAEPRYPVVREERRPPRAPELEVGEHPRDRPAREC